MYNLGSCSAWCSTKTFTGGYTASGSCSRSEKKVTCTSVDPCGYTKWSNWSEDSACSSPTGNDCTGTKCCRKVYKTGTDCGATSTNT